MSRPKKVRVCTDTEKKKVEIFNKIDEEINGGKLEEALANLQYLFRNSPSQRRQIKKKLAWLYYQIKDYSKTIAYLQDLIPIDDFMFNRMTIECLIQLGEKKRAVWHLAKAPLNIEDKKRLMRLISPEKNNESDFRKQNININQITIRCPYCTKFLFFFEKELKCLDCDQL